MKGREIPPPPYCSMIRRVGEQRMEISTPWINAIEVALSRHIYYLTTMVTAIELVKIKQISSRLLGLGEIN